MSDNVIKKARIAVPELPLVDIDLSCQHLTTGNFLMPIPAYCREVPKGKIKANIKSFTRLFPLQKPVMGSGKLSVNAFFVPFRTVWQPWSDFITDVPHNQSSGTSIIANVPTISNSELVSLFVLYNSNPVTGSVEYDFTNAGNHYTFTPTGRAMFRTLESLGYKVAFGAKKDFSFSALPLLCYVKAYMDWYFPSQFAHTGQYAIVDGYFNRNFTYQLSANDLNSLLGSVLYAAYDTDLFTGAFESPVGGNLNTFSRDFRIVDYSSFDLYSEGSSVADLHTVVGNENPGTLDDDKRFRSNDGTPGIHPFANGKPLVPDLGVVTQFSLDSLKALNDYIMRNSLAGSRALDRYLARYGKVLDADKLRRSYYLGSNKSMIEFGSVYSQSDTDGASLGEYAGKGSIVDFGSDFEVDTDEFGYFFVIATVIPDVCYFQGVDQNTRHITKLDFHTAEFDGLGNTALGQINVGVAMKNESYNGDVVERIFGFAPRYFEYKCPVDHITGDFRCDSVNGGLMAYSTARVLPIESQSSIVHDFNFVMGLDFMQYNRIFYTRKDDRLDCFYMVFRNNIKASFPVKRLYDTYDFDTDTNASVDLDLNGAKLN